MVQPDPLYAGAGRRLVCSCSFFIASVPQAWAEVAAVRPVLLALATPGLRTLTDQGKRVTFDDVAGAEEEKAELQEIVEFLRA